MNFLNNTPFSDLENSREYQAVIEFEKEIAAKEAKRKADRLAMPKPLRPFCTLDFETDPFHHGLTVNPFAWDFFDGAKHTTCFSERPKVLLEKLIAFLSSIPPQLIYAHNGGKFDFLFLLKWVRGSKMLIINSRIVCAHLKGHEIRDSFAILPVSLKEYEKQDFDYAKCHRKVRGQHRAEIETYLKSDTENLYKLVAAYRNEFGDVKTMASAAMKELKKFTPIFEGNPQELRHHRDSDTFFRQFYYGGRVQCFETGIIEKAVGIYDVNSMYPAVMKEFKHPVSAGGFFHTAITKRTFFMIVEGENYGAFPMRTRDGLSFTHQKGIYKVGIHEYNAALETGTFKPTKIHTTCNNYDAVTFDEFVDHFHHKRLQAKSENDKEHSLFYKLVMNSAYGKFAQDPANFEDYEFTDWNQAPGPQCDCAVLEPCTCGKWYTKLDNEKENFRLWAKSSDRTYGGYYNVETAASITSAARAVLLRAIVKAKSPLYCDTDSLICHRLKDCPIHESKLGFWKLEDEGDLTAICGKKTYAVFSRQPLEKWKDESERSYRERLKKAFCEGRYVHKLACKGVKISPSEILEVARGGVVEYRQEAPQFKLSGKQIPLTRKIRITG